MVNIDELSNKLDHEFRIQSYGEDSAFSRFIPEVYDSSNFVWKSVFEKGFTELFNGLMIRGAAEAERVFLAVFPTDDVLERFIYESREGDFLFMHHPLLMECGDPQGKWGRGFVPIKEEYIKRLKEKKLSVYTCHVPMDYHPQLGTSIAIAQALEADVTDSFLSNRQNEDLILVCRLQETDTERLMKKLKETFDIPYVDFEGRKLDKIQKIAVVAGCGDKVEWMREAEKRGVQAYISGEIHCHIDNDYGKKRYEEMKEYAKETSMSLIGVSHSASEYLVKKTLMKRYFEEKFGVETILIPQEKWWL